MAATSSFSEGSSVFGGSSNLVSAIETIFTVYDPDIIAVHTTCLSETIGDDMTQIISKAKEEGKVPDGKSVIYCNTPSYVGTHITGYSNQLSAFVKFFSTATPRKKNVVNLIAGWMEPADMRELKRLAALMEARIILFPDMSGVLDGPMTGKFQMYPAGGTTLQDITATGDSKFTIGLGAYSTEDACVKLENKCRVRFEVTEIPIGLKATDRFIVSLSRHANVPVPDAITEERGRLVDLIADNSKYFYGKRVALFGDPDTLIPLTEFLLTLDMRPVYIITGTPGKHFDESMEEMLSERIPEAKYKSGERADMFQLHQWIKQEPVDLLIGNTYGKYIARDENIPFIRLGFPVIDRPGNNYFPFVGYVGATNIAHRILDKILDHLDSNCPEEKVELQM